MTKAAVIGKRNTGAKLHRPRHRNLFYATFGVLHDALMRGRGEQLSTSEIATAINELHPYLKATVSNVNGVLGKAQVLLAHKLHNLKLGRLHRWWLSAYVYQEEYITGKDIRRGNFDRETRRITAQPKSGAEMDFALADALGDD